MYRHHSHITVKDADGWNTVVAMVAKVNDQAEELGLPRGTLWTETVGPYNHLVLETEYDSLAAFEEASQKMYSMPSFGEFAKALADVTDGVGRSELFERADQVFGG